MKDKIIIAATNYTNEGGGAVNRFIDLQCKGFIEFGYKVVVVSAYGDEFDFNKNMKKQLSVIQISRLPYLKLFPPNAKRFSAYLLWVVLLLWFAVRNKKSAWIFYGAAIGFAITIPWARFWGCKTSYLDADLPWGIHSPSNKSISKIVRKFVTRLSLYISVRSVNFIIIGGTSLLISYYKNIAPKAKIVQAWPPANIDLFASGNRKLGRKMFNISDDEFLIVYAGSVCAREGVHVLLDAYAILFSYIPNSKLIIAGNISQPGHHAWLDFQYTDYKSIIEALGINEKVIFGGMLKTKQLIDLLKAADVLVNPKVNHIYNAVALPIKIGEYLATSNPIISSKICEIDKYLVDGESVIIVPPDDPVSLSEKMMWVYKNRMQAINVGRKGYELALHHFNYSTWIEKYVTSISNH